MWAPAAFSNCVTCLYRPTVNKRSYQFILKNEKLVYYNRLGLLILLMHLFYFIYVLVRAPGSLHPAYPVVFIGLSLCGLILNRASMNSNANPVLPFALLFFIFACTWAGTGLAWISLAMGVLAGLDLYTRKKPTLLINEDHIQVPYLFTKTVAWNELNNLVLKDGIITLDFKNDHLFQSALQDSAEPVDETEFNAFCSLALTAKAQGREGTQE